MIGWLRLRLSDLDGTARAVRVEVGVNSLPNRLLTVFSINYCNMLVMRPFAFKRSK